MSMLVRSVVNPMWRPLIWTSVKMKCRSQTSTSTFSNVKTSAKQNVLIYEYKDRILSLLPVVGIIQFIGFNAVAYWSYFLFGTVTATPARLTTDSTLLERAATIVPTNRFRYTTTGLIVLISGAIFGACIMYPARCIRRLYLLKDGSSVGIVTYALWPSARKFIVPLEQVSSDMALHSVGIFHKFKIKSHRFSHLIHRKDGQFHNRTVYETVIALKRF